MDNNQTEKIIGTINILRSQRKRPDRINVGKFVASKQGLSENMVVDNVAALLLEARYTLSQTGEAMSLYMSQK